MGNYVFTDTLEMFLSGVHLRFFLFFLNRVAVGTGYNLDYTV
jgi:hypothetical protein